MLKYLLPLLLFSSSTFALEYAGQYTAKVKPKNCALGSMCHDSEYIDVLVILERRLITINDYRTKEYDVIAYFTDKTVNKHFTQKACPSIINNIGKSFKVTYDPYKKSYKLDCKNFK